MPLAAPIVAAIIGGGASIVGGALTNRGSSTTTPTLDPAYTGLRDQVLGMVTSRLRGATDLSGYEGSGVANINRGYQAAQANLENNLTARGLGRSPAATPALAKLNIGRAGDIATFRNSLPLLQEQIQTQRLAQAGDLLRTGYGSSTQQSYGGGAGGAFTNLAGYLGYLQGRGVFGGGGRSPLPATPTAPSMGFLPPGLSSGLEY